MFIVFWRSFASISWWVNCPY